MSALRSTAGRSNRRPASVAHARWVAFRTVYRTFAEDAFTDRALAGEAETEQLDARDRGRAQALAYGTVQHAKLLDHVIAVVGKRPLAKIDAPVLAALRLGTFELLEGSPGDAHAAVDQAVEIVRGVVGERAVAFTNAVLRRAQADGASIVATLDPDDPADLATSMSMPEWIVSRMRAEHGQDGLDALAALDAPRAGTPMRGNPLLVTGDELDAALAEAGVELGDVPAPFAALEPMARLVAGSTEPARALIDRGVIQPQAFASMLVTAVLDPQPGERVVDMCAAPGGKTMHIASRMRGEGSIVAVDVHEHRAASIAFHAGKVGASGIVTTRCADATTLTPEDCGGLADRVLLDAPCSGLGVIDTRPDLRWRRSAEDIAELVQLQSQLLRTAASLVRPGGTVVYSTCTMIEGENERVVARIIREGLLVPAPIDAAIDAAIAGDFDAPAPHMLRTWPQRDHTGGFFMARLVRPAEGAEDAEGVEGAG